VRRAWAEALLLASCCCWSLLAWELANALGPGVCRGCGQDGTAIGGGRFLCSSYESAISVCLLDVLLDALLARNCQSLCTDALLLGHTKE
jgi:hypothetical protein